MLFKSFKQRLAALEALEAQQAVLTEPLGLDDLDKLLCQVALHNVRMVDGRAVRHWVTGSAVYTAELDVALGRFNAMLLAEGTLPPTTEELYSWLCEQLGIEAPRRMWWTEEQLGQGNDGLQQ